MDARSRALAAGAVTVGIFLVVQLGALALVEPFRAAGYQAVEDPSDPANSVLYLVAILVITGVMLLAIRFEVTWLVRGGIVLASGFLSLYVFSVVVPPVLTVPLGAGSVNVLAVAAAGAVALGLLVYPEWYVIDAAGIVIGAGAGGIFGISFGLLPAILLLVALAVYDAVSVYGTEHMLTLASGVMDLKVPVILVIPLTLSYSFLDAAPPEGVDRSADGGTGEAADGDGRPAEERAEPSEPGDRDAFFIGLGDAVMPTVMVASAGFFAPAGSSVVPGLALTVPALGAIAGTLVGLVVLLRMVFEGRPHAGLPLLNGGAIGGYLVAALATGVPPVEALGLAPSLVIAP